MQRGGNGQEDGPGNEECVDEGASGDAVDERRDDEVAAAADRYTDWGKDRRYANWAVVSYDFEDDKRS